MQQPSVKTILNFSEMLHSQVMYDLKQANKYKVIPEIC